MSEEFTQGVSEGASSSAGLSDTTPTASPAGETQFAPEPVQATEEGAGTAPAVEEAPAEMDLNAIQPEAITDEQARKAFIHMRQGLREADEFKTQWETAASWLKERGGLEAIQPDVQMMDGLFAADLSERVEGFYRPLAEQNPQIYERMVADMATSPDVQDRVFAQLGVDPQEVALLKDAIQRGTWKDTQAEATGALAELEDQQLRGVYQALGPMERRIADSLYGEELQVYLQDQGQRLAAQYEARQRAHQEAVAYLEQQKTSTYQNVRGVIEKEVGKLFPNDTATTSLILGATETELYGSPEGRALWGEIEGHIERGETRAIQMKLPQMIARAQAIATKTAKTISETHEKARKFDELMRMGGEGEVMEYLRRVRGNGRQPDGGVPVNNNGRAVLPKPSEAGKYDPANVLSYFPGN